MEFRHLQSFLAIAEELHFGRAAAKLHLTQPSLSQQLQRLERTLGVRLVARTTHEVRLTPAGRAFEPQARAIVAHMEQAKWSAHEAAQGRAGVVRVGYNFPAEQHVLPAILRRMQTDYPNITVDLEQRQTGPQLAALLDDLLDVAFVYGRPTTPELRSRRLLRVPLVAVVGHQHRWAGRPGVPFAELGQQACVLFRRDLCPAMYDTITHCAEQARITLTVAHELDDPGATEILVSARHLVGFTSASRAKLAGSVVGGARVTSVQLYSPVPLTDLYVVWRAEENNQPRDSFLECLDAVSPFSVPPSVGDRGTAR